MMSMRADGEFRIPLDVQPVCQTMDDIQAVGVPVDQCERGAAQFFGAQQGGEGVLAKGGAACADDNDLGGKGHGILTYLNLNAVILSVNITNKRGL